MSLIVIHNICEVFFLPIIIIYRMRECFFYHLQQYDPYSTITRSRHGAISFFMYFDEITLGKCIIMFFSAITSLKDHLLLKWYTDSITTKRDHRNYIHTYSIFLRDSIIVLLTHFPQIAQNCSQHYLRHTKAKKYVSLFYSISCNHFCCQSINMMLQYLLDFGENFYAIIILFHFVVIRTTTNIWISFKIFLLSLWVK